MAGGGSNYTSGRGDFRYRNWIGPNHPDPKDTIRNWVTWLKSDDPRVMQNLYEGTRKQADWDDHKEAYPLSLDGPHVYCSLYLPAGEYLLSCYHFNKDGHSNRNRYRDYDLQVRLTPMTFQQFDPLSQQGKEAADLFAKSQVGDQSRVKDFWGGVWKRFYVRNPTSGCFTIRVDANYSMNSTISGVCLDAFAGKKPSQRHYRAFLDDVEQRWKSPPVAAASAEEMAGRVVQRLLTLRDEQPRWYLTHGRCYVISLVRLLLQPDGSGRHLAERIDSYVKLDTWRPAVAILLNDIQQFDWRDKVFFSPDHYDSFAWDGRAGRGREWEWNEGEFVDWLRKKRSIQIW